MSEHGRSRPALLLAVRRLVLALPIASGIIYSAVAHDGALDPHFGTSGNGRVIAEFCPASCSN